MFHLPFPAIFWLSVVLLVAFVLVGRHVLLTNERATRECPHCHQQTRVSYQACQLCEFDILTNQDTAGWWKVRLPDGTLCCAFPNHPPADVELNWPTGAVVEPPPPKTA